MFLLLAYLSKGHRLCEKARRRELVVMPGALFVLLFCLFFVITDPFLAALYEAPYETRVCKKLHVESRQPSRL